MPELAHGSSYQLVIEQPGKWSFVSRRHLTGFGQPAVYARELLREPELFAPPLSGKQPGPTDEDPALVAALASLRLEDRLKLVVTIQTNH